MQRKVPFSLQPLGPQCPATSKRGLLPFLNTSRGIYVYTSIYAYIRVYTFVVYIFLTYHMIACYTCYYIHLNIYLEDYSLLFSLAVILLTTAKSSLLQVPSHNSGVCM